MNIEGLTKEEQLKAITKYVPEGESPKVYWKLLKEQVMGVDRNGNPRPDEDTLYFLFVCKKTGLDPLVKQIYPVYRWDNRIGAEKMSIQVGIDGMRLVAQRTEQYGGSSDVVYDAEDQAHPKKASVTVYKIVNGIRIETTATARWNEYVQIGKEGKVIGLWNKMPYLMLGKCAESLALRKAFPNELSGLYTSEEMSQQDSVKEVLSALPKPEKAITENSENNNRQIDFATMRRENK